MPDELELLKSLGREDAEPDEEAVARARTLLEQRINGVVATAPSGQGVRAGGLSPRLRWSLLVAAVALLVGSGLGFGLGSSLTPSGSAGGNFVGFGFLPAQGWSVMQSGELDARGVARAVAANVPLDSRDDLAGPPRATLGALPVRGVLVLATFRPRGDPEEDFKYPHRELPLALEQSVETSNAGKPAQYRLRASVRGYNVDLRVFFGSTEPSAGALATAQRQLDRLVVAADRVTISVRPAIAGSLQTNGAVTIFGSIDSGTAGETVEIQAKDCGTDFFRLVSGVTTESGGSWSTRYWPGINTTVRAVWDDVASAQVPIRARVSMSLQKKRDGRTLRVAVRANRSFWHKRVEIQRQDRRLGTWKRVQTVVLTETFGNRGSGPAAGAYTYADFRAAIAKGALLRAVMPRSQVKPCYLAGISNTLRT